MNLFNRIRTRYYVFSSKNPFISYILLVIVPLILIVCLVLWFIICPLFIVTITKVKEVIHVYNLAGTIFSLAEALFSNFKKFGWLIWPLLRLVLAIGAFLLGVLLIFMGFMVLVRLYEDFGVNLGQKVLCVLFGNVMFVSGMVFGVN